MAAQFERHNGRGYGPLTRAFKQNPTIENYVALRRQNPDVIVEIAITSARGWLSAVENAATLRSYGIQQSLCFGTLDANDASISELSLLLMEQIIQRRSLRLQGETQVVGRGKAIPDSLVNFLISMMLDGLEWNDVLLINRDLIVLIRHMLGSDRSVYDDMQKVSDLRWSAAFIARQLLDRGEKPTYRVVARYFGVNATTVKRWFPGKSLTEVGEDHPFSLADVLEMRRAFLAIKGAAVED